MVAEELRAEGGPRAGQHGQLLSTGSLNGRIESANASWELVTGWSREELRSRPIADFIHPGDRANAVAAMANAAKPGRQSVEFECRFRARHGQWRWLRWSVQGDGESWFASASDVTSEKEDEGRLRQALTPDHLLAYGQPIVDRRRRAVAQEELLVRMRSPVDPGRVLLPGQFLPDAERLGLVGLVDRWMVGRAIAMAAEGRRAEVNLSARSIGDRDFMAELEDSVRRAGPTAANLVFEIAESTALGHLEVAVEFSQRLTALGCQFALDNFGTGFGSLTHLRWLPIQFVKIDSSFVRHAPVSAKDRAMVEGIVGIAHRLGIATVAEGVEDAAALNLLGACGVDYAQGFLLGPPVPIRQPPALDGRRHGARALPSPSGAVTVPRAVAGSGRPRPSARPAFPLASLVPWLVVCAVALAVFAFVSSAGVFPRLNVGTRAVLPSGASLSGNLPPGSAPGHLKGSPTLVGGPLAFESPRGK